MRILVVRNDKLGDFMLAWPAFRALKENLPDAEVVALVPHYTRSMAELCPWIDRPLLDPGPEAGLTSLVSLLRGEHFDAVITLFSTPRVGAAAWMARIPYRLAPATKWCQVFYNTRLIQRRSRSEKPEWVYNLDLAARFLADHARPLQAGIAPPYLRFPASELKSLREDFCNKNGIDDETRLVFIHPGSGGSAANLSLDQYAGLLHGLHSRHPSSFVLSAGPNEERYVCELSERLRVPHVIYRSIGGLQDFARHIAFADLWISGSTGPLHIAGALDVPTAAFYPRRRSATPLRWQTLNSPERRLAFAPPEGVGERDMGAIDLNAAAAAISTRFLA